MSPSERMDLLTREVGIHFEPEHEYRGEVGKDRARYELPGTLEGFQAPFTAIEWVEMCQREGDFYVGGCCGNMGALQDVMAGVFRDGGWLDASTLHRIAEAAIGHDGFNEFDPMDDERFTRSVDEWAYHRREHADMAIDPWALLGIIYNAVGPTLKPTKRTDTPVFDPKRPQRPEALVYETFSRTMWELDWHTLYTPPEDPKRDATHRAAGVLLRARALPALRLLLSDIEALNETWKGFAIVRAADRSLLDTYGGYCLYGTREHAEEIVGYWAKGEEFDPAAILILPATITIEDGLVLGEP